MKNNKKGFTLIELLAVIVILAIIALIATPIVLNIIAKARKSAAQDSLYGVMSAAKTTYMSTLLDDTQIKLPAYIECNGTDCSVFNATVEEDGTYAKAATSPEQNDKDGNQFKVSFSGTVPGKSDALAAFAISKDGKILNTTSDLNVNGFNCSITNEKVTCS